MENKEKTDTISLPQLPSVDSSMDNDKSDATSSVASKKDEPPLFSIMKIYKNLILIAIAFVLMFTAYNGMVTLQSSLNVKGNVGVNSLIITYAFLIVSEYRIIRS